MLITYEAIKSTAAFEFRCYLKWQEGTSVS